MYMSETKDKRQISLETKLKSGDFSEILKLLKKLLSTSRIISRTPVTYFKSNCKCIDQINHCFNLAGDEITADVSPDDHQLLAYHFHIPEGLCGKLGQSII